MQVEQAAAPPAQPESPPREATTTTSFFLDTVERCALCGNRTLFLQDLCYIPMSKVFHSLLLIAVPRTAAPSELRTTWTACAGLHPAPPSAASQTPLPTATAEPPPPPPPPHFAPSQQQQQQ